MDTGVVMLKSDEVVDVVPVVDEDEVVVGRCKYD